LDDATWFLRMRAVSSRSSCTSYSTARRKSSRKVRKRLSLDSKSRRFATRAFNSASESNDVASSSSKSGTDASCANRVSARFVGPPLTSWWSIAFLFVETGRLRVARPRHSCRARDGRMAYTLALFRNDAQVAVAVARTVFYFSWIPFILCAPALYNQIQMGSRVWENTAIKACARLRHTPACSTYAHPRAR